MRKVLVLVAVVMVFVFTSCTGNQRAKNFGGDYTIELDAGQKLVEATWKGDANLWYLTRKRTEAETPTTYKFHEDSNLGLMEGTVTFIEQ